MGFSCLVTPNGARWWRLKYRIEGREKLLSLGIYPDVSLKTARERRDDARKLIADGIDPSRKRRAAKRAVADTFEGIAREWLDQQRKRLASNTFAILVDRLERFAFPNLGNRSVASITAEDLLTTLRRVESQGKHETAHRVRSLCGRILRYAVTTGRAERDVSGDLRGALTPVKTTNFAALTEPVRIGGLLRAIDGYDGQPAAHAALRLAPLVFVRPGELRAAEWSNST